MRVMLMLSDREEISRGLAEGLEYKEIALRLGRDPSVISRDVSRHGGRQGSRAAAADRVACATRERPKPLAVERSARLRAVVCRQPRGGWSPASIAGRLAIDYPDDDACRVSHEAIYQWVYAQPVSTLAKELISLRTGRKARRGGRRPPPATVSTSPGMMRRRRLLVVVGRGASSGRSSASTVGPRGGPALICFMCAWTPGHREVFSSGDCRGCFARISSYPPLSGVALRGLVT